MNAPRLPEQIGYVKLRSMLAESTSTKVWLGLNTRTGEKAVVKLVDIESLSQQGVEAATREVQLLMALDSPLVVRVLDYAIEQDLMYIVQEYADGGTLKAFVDANPKFFQQHPDSAKAVIRSLLLGLNALHKQGIVWRNCSPENILLMVYQTPRDAFQYRPLIASLGLTKQLVQEERTLYAAGAYPDAMFYMAPEQIDGPKIYSTQADVWGLGLVLHYMMTADVPFDVAELRQNIQSKQLQKPFQCSDEDLRGLFERMTCMKPYERESCESLLETEWIRELAAKISTAEESQYKSKSAAMKGTDAGVWAARKVKRMEDGMHAETAAIRQLQEKVATMESEMKAMRKQLEGQSRDNAVAAERLYIEEPCLMEERARAVWAPVQQKSNEEIALEVERGLWGDEEQRRERLCSAGYDMDAVQYALDRMARKQ